MAKIGKRLESHAAEEIVLRIERVNMKQIPAIEKLVINGGINVNSSDIITSFIVNFRSLTVGSVCLNRRGTAIDTEHIGLSEARSIITSVAGSIYWALM